MMDDNRLKQIQEREAKATKGPWVFDPHTSTVSTHIAEAYDLVTQNMALDDGTPEDFANCEFIQEARADIPDLLAALKQAQQRERIIMDLLQGAMVDHEVDMRTTSDPAPKRANAAVKLEAIRSMYNDIVAALGQMEVPDGR